MIYDDNTMDVVTDNQLVRRPIDRSRKPFGYSGTNKLFPKLEEGEFILWEFNNDVPYLFKKP